MRDDNDLFIQYEKEFQDKKAIVRSLIKDALRYACKLHNVIAVCNPTNESAYPLIFDGATTKSHTVTAKTQKIGLLKGFITDNLIGQKQKMEPVRLRIGKKEFYVGHNDFGDGYCLFDIVVDKNKLIHVLCDNEGRFITSDLDILMLIPLKTEIQREAKDLPDMGCILDYEYDFASSLNQYFCTKLFEANGRNAQQQNISLVMHGPFNRFSGTKRSHIHFPLNITNNNAEELFLGSESSREHSLNEFTHMLKMLQVQGYDPEPHINWNLF